jgi:hypothetical protein
MNHEAPAPRCERLAANPDAVCAECGAAGAVEFGHVALCVSCYAEKGSCCPEFGKDDLWRQRAEFHGR